MVHFWQLTFISEPSTKALIFVACVCMSSCVVVLAAKSSAYMLSCCFGVQHDAVDHCQ